MITYLDENDFIKKEKGLKRYFKKSYTYFIFEIKDKLKRSKLHNGIYEVSIPVDDLFVKVYGELKVKYSVFRNTLIFEDILPSDILLECYSKNLPVYNGMPYRDKKDLFKIKLHSKIKKEGE